MNGQNTEADAGAVGVDADRQSPPECFSATDADDLPIRLVFIAGELDVALRELRRIAPGYVFELRQPVDRHVEVRANGKTIGTGELVEVDGRVGVRLLTCNQASAG